MKIFVQWGFRFIQAILERNLLYNLYHHYSGHFLRTFNRTKFSVLFILRSVMAPWARKPVDPVLAKLYKARHSVKHPDAKKISDKMYRDRAKSNPEKKKLIQEQTKARVRAFRAKKGKFNKQGLRANPIDLSWLGGMTGRQTSLSVDLINLFLESTFLL